MKENDDASVGFFAVDAETLFDNAQKPVVAPAGPEAGVGSGSSLGNGGATALGDLLSGVQAAARRIANFATYYQMKSRAGTVGSKGVSDLLRRVRATKPTIRIHLVGHSFGALVALLVVVRVIRKLSPGLAGRVYGAPIALVLVLQAAALAQLASVTTPVFPTRTPMGQGVDGLVKRHAAPAHTAEENTPAPVVEAAR